MFKIYLIVAFIGAIGSGYAYHQVTVSNFEVGIALLEANNRTLKENQEQLDIAINAFEASLKAAEENAKKSEAAMSALTSRNQELNREKQTYLKIFKDHNLTRLARAKPGMIEKRINNGTQKVFEALENDTKELMDVDTPDDATDGVRPEQDIRNESNPTERTTKDS